MYPPDILEIMKDCLRTIYWYKRQLRTFLEKCHVPQSIISDQRWDDPQEYKVFIADKVVNELSGSEQYILPMRELIRRITEMEDFSHLLKEDEGKRLKREAEVNVERLRQVVTKHDAKIRSEEEARKERQRGAEERAKAASKIGQLEQLKACFYDLVATASPQRRGQLFEPFLFDLFNAFDLYPRGSFALVGEQIDGAFEMGSQHYLLEAKWEQDPIGARELRYFKEQVESKLDNTLGLFISINGFTNEGIEAFQRSRPNIFLMDGEDLSAVLEGFIDLRELLHRKQRHAAQTGEVYRRFRDIAGK